MSTPRLIVGSTWLPQTSAHTGQPLLWAIPVKQPRPPTPNRFQTLLSRSARVKEVYALEGLILERWRSSNRCGLVSGLTFAGIDSRMHAS